MSDLLCVKAGDAHAYGCPVCASRDFSENLRAGSAGRNYCSNCRSTFVTMHNGANQSSMGIPIGGYSVFPSVMPHPFKGSSVQIFPAK